MLECTVFRSGHNHGINLGNRSDTGRVRGNRVRSCVLSRNSQHGIDISGTSSIGNLIEANVVHNTTNSAGIADSISVFKGDHNRIVDNHVTGGDRGIILAAGDECVVTGNSLFDNADTGFTYSIGTVFVVGPISTRVGLLTNSGADAHPWANFTR